jgi:hypothetical protein
MRHGRVDTMDDREHLMSLVAEFGDHRPPDQTRTSGDRDAHAS